MEKENMIALYRDYKRICEMEMPDISLRARLLSELLGSTPDPWCVVGITPAALEVFSKHNFRREARMGINRAHINRRFDWLKEMLENEFSDPQKWWDFYIENDKTVLATASENRTADLAKIEKIPVPKHLFRNHSYALKDGKEEREFLRELHKNRLTNS